VPTAADTLLAQITALDARISEVAGATQMQDGTVSASFSNINDLIDARNRLQAMYDRLTGAKPLAVRGRVLGLPNGPVSSTTYV
jgi:hypothetical protein